MALLFDQNIDINQDVKKKYEYSYSYEYSPEMSYNIQRDYTINLVYQSPNASLSASSSKQFEDLDRRMKQYSKLEQDKKSQTKFTGGSVENIAFLVVLGIVGYKVLNKIL